MPTSKKSSIRPKIASKKTHEPDVQTIASTEGMPDDVFTVRSVAMATSRTSSLDGSTMSSDKTRDSHIKGAKWKTVKSEISKGSHYIRAKLNPARKRNAVKEICILPPSPAQCWTPEGPIYDDELVLASRESSASSNKTMSTSSTTDSELVIYDAENDGEL